MEQAFRMIGKRKVTWVCMNALPDLKLLEKISGYLNIDAYEMKTIIEYSRGRSKMEDFGNALFVSWPVPSENHEMAEVQPAYFVLGIDYLVTFQDTNIRYDEIVARLRNEHSRLRKSGPDFLLFALLAEIIGVFFDRVEELSNAIDHLEDRLIANSNREVLQEVRQMRARIGNMWRAAWPLRETAESLAERNLAVIKRSNQMYFRELFNNLDLLLHEVDGLGQIIPQLIDLYETSTSNQLNQIVKVLTVFSVVFAPLTLIAGIYGMNFEHMPELAHFLGYPMALILMASISSLMVLYFYRKGWIFVEKKRA